MALAPLLDAEPAVSAVLAHDVRDLGQMLSALIAGAPLLSAPRPDGRAWLTLRAVQVLAPRHRASALLESAKRNRMTMGQALL